MKYYPFSKKWKKLKPLIESDLVQTIMVEDFNKFTYGRWRKKFQKGMKPLDFESCDWYMDRKGRKPQFWNYVKHSACHWVVNFQLELAQLAEPKKKWRIITSQDHSVVWDGEETLFDMNFCALGVSPEESFTTANKKQLPIGQKLKVYLAQHYTTL